MKGVFRIYFSEYFLCIISRRSSKRSRLDIHNASEYEMEGYSNFKQRFCTRSMSFGSFLVRPGSQTGHFTLSILQYLKYILCGVLFLKFLSRGVQQNCLAPRAG